MKRVITKQQRYAERQKSLGRREAKLWVTPEEAEVARKAVKEYRALQEKCEA